MASAGRGFLLLLNESLLTHVVGMPAPEKRRLREKLEFLGAGIWDSGLRVKKLRGTSRKVVFEARMSKGDRLLFTLGRDRERSQLYLWSLVSHDDVGRSAQRVGGENAPFLQLQDEESEEHEEITLTDLPEDYYTQEPLEARLREEHGSQKWLVLDDTEWERLLLASPADDLSVHLYLTREQERFLTMDPPLLLSGTAGSGKTTICVYYLLRPEYRGTRRLFVTYSPHLRRFSERIYRGLVRHSATQDGADPEFLVLRDLVSRLLGEDAGRGQARVADFAEFERIYSSHAQRRSYDPELVWEEIRSIIKGAKPAVSLQRLRSLAEAYLEGAISERELGELQEMLVGLDRLELSRELRRKTPDYQEAVRGMVDRRRDDAERRLLEGVTLLVDKRAGRLGGPLLSYEEYADLGQKRAPNFRYDRKAVYALAEFYQTKLEESGREDEADRARRALGLLARGGVVRLYDLVVCDEVQDLCDLEISLLLRLASGARGVVLAGDVKQIINPSGFRWEEVRRSFYERGLKVPEVFRLSLNFRCVGSIVRLANAVLDLKQRLVGIVSSEAREDWKWSGRPPLLLVGPDEQAVLRDVDLRTAGRIIIVRTREDKERLAEALGSELVFTIHEAKGLEFDTVLLWKLEASQEQAALWRQALSGLRPEEEHAPRLRQELSLLYVALTRARNGLVLYEGAEASPIWGLEELRDLFYRTADPSELAAVWRHASSPEEWERQGDYFFDREYWRAAEECYRNAGAAAKQCIAEARRLGAEGRHAEAADLYERSGMREQAAESWETAGELARAMELWKALGRADRFLPCRAALYEAQGEHAKAADEWEKLGNMEAALKNWELGKIWDRVGRYWLEWKQYRRSAEAFERAGLLLEAGESLERAKEPARAAGLYERARAWDRAARLYRRLGEEDRLLACLHRIPDHRAAAVLHEKRGELEEAIAALRRLAGGGPEAAAELRKELEELGGGRTNVRRLRAMGVRAAALGEHAEAARSFEEAGEADLAFREWRELGDYGGMARCLAAQGRPAEAARLLERGDPSQRDLVAAYLEQSLGAPGSPDLARLKELREEAKLFEARGDREAALIRYRLLDEEEKLAELYAALDRDEEALGGFLRAGRFATALRFLGLKPRLRVGAPFLEREIRLLGEAMEAGTSNWFAEGMMDCYARVALGCLDADPAAEAPARAFLDMLPDFVGLWEELPDRLCDLALRVRHYNAIQTILWTAPHKHADRSRRLRTGFLASLRAAAESSEDRVLLASWASVMDQPLCDSLMPGIPLTERTVRLYESSPTLHGRAVTYHVARGAWERGAMVHRWWGEGVEAAAVYEEAGDAKAACTLYRQAKEFGRSLACAQRCGNEIEMARAYEGLGQYRRAVDIWSSLGRRRDVERLRRRLTEQEEPPTGVFER